MNSLVGSLRIERLELENGLVVLVNPRPESELIVIKGSCRAGALFDDAAHSGLSRFVAGMMMRGTGKRKHMQIIDEAESLGAGIRFHADDDLAWSSSRCTPPTLNKTVEILFDCMTDPIFPESEVEKVRGLMLTQIKEREDSTSAVASRTAREMLFPEGNRYHTDPGGYEETINAITRDDICSFWKKHYGPQSTILSFSGSITSDRVREALSKHCRNWEPAGRNPEFPSVLVKRPIKAARRVTPMMHKSQVDIAVMCQTVPRNHPDNYALGLANTILGTMGLMGRLGKNIRDRQGLAYYAASSHAPRTTGGYWLAYAGVNPANVDRAAESILDEMKRIGREPVTKREHRDAITNRIGSLALRLETCEAAAALMHEIERFDLGLDFVDRYEAIIRSLTRDDIQRVSADYLRPDECVTSIVGPYQARR